MKPVAPVTKTRMYWSFLRCAAPLRLASRDEIWRRRGFRTCILGSLSMKKRSGRGGGELRSRGGGARPDAIGDQSRRRAPRGADRRTDIPPHRPLYFADR